MLSLLRFRHDLYYGWVVVAAFLVIGIALYGTVTSFGVFFKAIEGEFHLTRATTSALVSTNMLLTGILAIAAGWVSDRYGPRIIVLLMGLFTGLSLILTSQTNSLWQIFITYGLLLSLGASGIYAVPTSIISRWFDKQRGFAIGIAGSGVGLGQLIMAPLATFLISRFDWRMAYLAIGIATWLIIIPLSRLLRRSPTSIGASPNDAESPPDVIENIKGIKQQVGANLLQICGTGSFWVHMTAWLVYGLSCFLVLTHLVPHATDIGISPMAAAGILSLVGGSATAGRVLTGIISDRIGSKLAAMICTLLQAVAMLWLIWATELWMLYLFALIYGFGYSGLGTALGTLGADTFGLARIGIIFGALLVGFGIGAAIGPYMGGLIFDVSNSYSMAFLIGGLAMLVETSLLALTRRGRVKTVSVCG